MHKKYVKIFYFLTVIILFNGCGNKPASDLSDSLHIPLKCSTDIIVITESMRKTVFAPGADTVKAARTSALSSMTIEETQRLTENIRIANQTLENAYFYGSFFDNLADKDSLNWNYIDQKGDIQIGWGSDGAPVMDYNHFDADNFIILLEDIKTSIHNPELINCLELLISYTRDAKYTHDVVYIEEIFHLIHDMDYFLLRYGLEDVAPYVQDSSFIRKYFGTLPFYG